MPPPIAMVCTFCCLAALATPEGVLPKAVWKSIRPSPVMTRSAPLICFASSVASTTISTPLLSFAPVNATRPAPKPPAAPAPFNFMTSLCKSLLIILAKYFRFASSFVTMAGVAPFCGPKTCAAPFLPQSGFSTSLATVTLVLFTFGSIPLISILAILFNIPPVPNSCISRPFLSRNLTPSACAMPAPPSIVADPPKPRMMWFAPLLIASIINWPVPYVVVFMGFLSFVPSTSGRPEASAISITAVLPSANMP